MKPIYFFDEIDGKNKRLLGGKGAGLCEMTRIGLPVPPGFVITTKECEKYYENDKKLPANLMSEVKRNLKKIEKRTGKEWNSTKNPLLVSVRSGAAISMPGMMDTILNLGLNDKTVHGLASETNNPRFALDSYRRFISIFGKVVFGISDKEFDDEFEKIKKKQKAKTDSELNTDSLKSLVSSYKHICKKHTKHEFPQDPSEQIKLAIEAVFKSWTGERAVVYRKRYNITPDIANGTAVNIVAMVFGNMGDDSATGVVFTRNPENGHKKIYGEYLKNAQGEDVVAGIRTPKPVNEMQKDFAKAYKTLLNTCYKLEKHYEEPQDIEFTVEKGKLFLLQTRKAKMNAAAMIKTSYDLVKEKKISKERAIERLDPYQLEQLLHSTIDFNKTRQQEHPLLAKGIGASPGAATGTVVFSVKKATELGDRGTKVILVREETKPEDVPAFFASEGILTSRGGKTSHAAVVARGMGKPCIVGCSDLKINYTEEKLHANGRTISEGETITIDGSSGNLFLGIVPTVEPKLTGEFKTILRWSEAIKKLGIRANADTMESAKIAKEKGAKGIGLCRTERMFNKPERLEYFVEMIMAESAKERRKILEKLKKLQKQDFVEILKIMGNNPVTIRLLDPPLHEFLPPVEELTERIHKLSTQEKKQSHYSLEKTKRLLARAKEMSETNPMMGHRGVRLGISYPEIYEMQIRAIFEAAEELSKRKQTALPQIMVPQVGIVSELKKIKEIYARVLSEHSSNNGPSKRKPTIHFGSMLEVVRACITAEELAEHSDFFSFGTNDLTQAVFSYSREDAEGKFLPRYIENEIISENPFQSIDESGVGDLMRIAVDRARNSKPKMEIGICGEHGGDPKSVVFCHNLGLSYVSASSHRIPVTIISAAQANIKKQKGSSNQ